MSNIHVSVCIITYNQQDYIAEAIEGALAQKCNFNYEIIIGDDYSTDKTSEIVEKYRVQYPAIIKHNKRAINLGMIGNWKNTIEECSGKYIAICEGDDYWTDPYKLQKQVDFLEENSDYAICFHNTEERTVSNTFSPSFLYCNSSQKETSTIYDLAYSNFIPTCSAVFRNKLFDKFPEWFNDISIGDWPLHFLNVQYGKIHYIPHVMGVHRIHAGGVWSLQAQSKSISLVIEVYNKLISWTNDKLLIQHLETGRTNLEMQLSALSQNEQTKINNNKFLQIVKKGVNLLCPPILYKLYKKSICIY